MHRIFIVEDDAAIAAALQKHLTTWGFDVRCAEDFRNVLTECTAFDPQLVLLDITLPFYNGYHWCQELRLFEEINRGGQTILMVTHSVKAASHASRVLFIKDGEVFHEIYRGESSDEQLYQKISDTLTMLATGGEHHA